jgi:hypothetical protein
LRAQESAVRCAEKSEFWQSCSIVWCVRKIATWGFLAMRVVGALSMAFETRANCQNPDFSAQSQSKLRFRLSARRGAQEASCLSCAGVLQSGLLPLDISALRTKITC